MKILLVLAASMIGFNISADPYLIDITPPTVRSDGSPLSPRGIAGFQVYSIFGQALYPDITPIAGPVTTITIPTGAPIQQPFDLLVKTIDTGGRVSASTRITIPVVGPKAEPGEPGVTVSNP